VLVDGFSPFPTCLEILRQRLKLNVGFSKLDLGAGNVNHKKYKCEEIESKS